MAKKRFKQLVYFQQYHITGNGVSLDLHVKILDPRSLSKSTMISDGIGSRMHYLLAILFVQYFKVLSGIEVNYIRRSLILSPSR